MPEARYLAAGKPPAAGAAAPAAPVLACSLCPHLCVIPDGKTGLCRVRANRGGKGVLPYYGKLSALAVDPIEKKPLYHFRPGTSILSAGFWGCNLRCPFCQNWSISQRAESDGRTVDGRDLVVEGRRSGLEAIAYTYSEPLVHLEFLTEAMAAARDAGMANVLVTNGCVNDGPAREVLALADGVNVDLKSFSRETYLNVLGGNLAAVLNFLRVSVELGVHLEVTTLVVPGLNDSQAELDGCRDFLADLSPDIPWHLSAYHPAYKWTAAPTDGGFLKAAARRAAERLRYVYLGNLGEEESNTPCAACGAVLVRRRRYRVDVSGLQAEDVGGGRTAYVCASCGAAAPFRA